MITNQEKELIIEMKSRKPNQQENVNMLKKLVILILLTCGILQADTTPMQAGRDIWGETWTCPNPKCRYENYEGISSCAICGTSRYAKK